MPLNRRRNIDNEEEQRFLQDDEESFETEHGYTTYYRGYDNSRIEKLEKRHKMVIALFLLILTLSILAVALSFFLPKESLDPLSQLQKTVKENSQNIVKLNSSYQDLENLFEESSREIEKLYNLIEINCKKGTIKPKDGRPQFLYLEDSL